MSDVKRPTARLLAAVLAVVALAGPGMASGGPGARGESGTRFDARPGSFGLHGHVTGLYPGARRRMRVIVRNPRPYAIEVTSVRVRAADPVPGCPGSMVRVRWHRRRVRIEAGRAARVLLLIALRRAAPDACQGVRFPLTFNARAVRA